jgi:arylsulfatase A-like enzyme
MKLVLFVSLLLVGLCAANHKDDAPLRPNIVVLFVDDLGYGDLHTFGHPTMHTPNIDALAAEGMKFTSWYSASAICTPSRAALLTGRLPVRTGFGHDVFQAFGTNMQSGGLPYAETTIAEGLKAAGYHTGMAGKWHLGVNAGTSNTARFSAANMPIRHGFDSSSYVLPLGNTNVCFAADPVTAGQWCHLWRNDKVTQMKWHVDQFAGKMAREFTTFLSHTPATTPYFWYHSFIGVHTPVVTSAAFTGRNPGCHYCDMVEEMDYEVGLVMAAIHARGDNNTIVFFVSDNGPYLEEFVTQNVGQTSAGPFKGGKGQTWEGGFRVPAIAWYPGHIPADTVRDQIISTLDIFPTALSLAGEALPAGEIIDGKDQTNLLFNRLGGYNQDPWKNSVYPYFCGTQLMAVRWKKFKMHYITQKFIDTAGHPTPNTTCHGECCPYAPSDPFGVCGCSDLRLQLNPANLQYAITAPPANLPRVDHHTVPLLFDLDKDVHESNPLTPENFEDYEATRAVIQALVDELKATIVVGTFQTTPGVIGGPLANPGTLSNPNLQPACLVPTGLPPPNPPFTISFTCDYELPFP